MSAHCSMSIDFISLVERGINAPSFETIETLCSCFGIEANALFTFPPEVITTRGRVKRSVESKAKKSAKKKAKR
jgi:hypothetical protein